MNERFTWYKLGFIVNSIVLFALTSIICYATFIVKAMVSDTDITMLWVIAGVAAIYISNDVLGLNIINQVIARVPLSGKKTTWAIVSIILTGLLNIFLALVIYAGFYIYIKFNGTNGFRKATTSTLWALGLMSLILISGIYNFIISIKLIKKAKAAEKEFEDLVKEIGTGQ